MPAPNSNKSPRLDLRAGEWVEVRSQEEILATLDERGRLEAMPFMPEMLQYCGKRFRVQKRADKTCDNIKPWSLRRVQDAVHLMGVRCGGSAHGDCDAGCLIFWREEWLKRAEPEILPASNLGAPGPSGGKVSAASLAGAAVCTIESLQRASRRPADQASAGEEIYSCQATDLREFTSDLAWWDFRHYLRDIRSGNLYRDVPHNKSEKLMETLLSMVEVLRVLLISSVNKLQGYRHGLQYPHIEGTLDSTPVLELGLRPGDFVQVKSKEEIVATLDRRNRNRGLLFDSEMVRHCGGTFRVLKRVHQIVDEKTGKIMKMKSPCIILEGVACVSDYHKLCPRAIYHYWREGWLRRAE